MEKLLNLAQIPDDLTEDSKQIWRSILKDYRMDNYLYVNLHMALLARQQAVVLMEELESEGYCTDTARGIRTNPKATVLNQMMSQFYKGIKQTGIELKEK
jgi:hypothetical protein